MSDHGQADVVVVGGGPAGCAAAAAALAASGGSARVVLVDDGPAGPRPVPGPPLAAALRASADGGAGWGDVRQAAAALLAPATRVTGRGLLAGIEVLNGRAALSGTGGWAAFGAGGVRLDVVLSGADAAAGPTRLTARRAVLATGSVPGLPEVTGLLDTRHVTCDTLLDLDDLPPSVAVVGAGPRGVALAQALARLGPTVSLVEARPRVLPGFDPAVGEAVEVLLQRDGVRLLLGSPVVKVAPTLDDGAWIGTESGSDVAAELLVVATGRRPDVAGLDLPSAGVRLAGDGTVDVDDRLRTTNHDVLAVGRVTGRPADPAAARLAGANAVARLRPGRYVPSPLPRTVPTDPPVAVVGQDERRAAHRPEGAVVHETTGPGRLVRAVVAPDRGRRLLGVALVTAGARDAGSAAALAVQAGAAADRLADLAAPGSALADVAAALAAPGRAAETDPAGAGTAPSGAGTDPDGPPGDRR